MASFRTSEAKPNADPESSAKPVRETHALDSRLRGNDRMIWGLLDDRPGHANQVRGLVEALCNTYSPLVGESKHAGASERGNAPSPSPQPSPIEGEGVTARFITLSYNGFARLPNLLLGASVLHLAARTRAELTAPWPAIVVACGRRTEPVARWIKKRSPATKIVYIMTPARLCGWDAVIVPEHDRPEAAHPAILTTHGPLHRITPALLDAARDAWNARFAAYPGPRIGVLFGDTGIDDAERILERAEALAGETGSLLISNSRRTMKGLVEVLSRRIARPYFLYDWHNGTGDNPYAAILASADKLIVSGDSLSMCVEAVAAGKPVYIASNARLPAKHRQLHRSLWSQGHALPLEGEGAAHITPVNDTARIAQALKERFGL